MLPLGHPLGRPAGNKKFFFICWVILLKFIIKYVIILKKHNFTERNTNRSRIYYTKKFFLPYDFSYARC